MFPDARARLLQELQKLVEEVITNSAEETTNWGRQLATRLKSSRALTAFRRARQRKNHPYQRYRRGPRGRTEDDVTSPTFTLVHVYGDAQKPAVKVYHADLYRIKDFTDFETLGLEEVFDHPAVLILEWAERFPLRCPWPKIQVRLEHLEGDQRGLTVISELVTS